MESFTITDRLKTVMAGIPQRKFAKQLEISPSTLWEYSRGRIPPADFIAKVCERFQISERWFLTGKGEMRRPPDELDSTTHQILTLLQSMDAKDKRYILQLVQKEKLLMDLLEEREQKEQATIVFLTTPTGNKLEVTGALLEEMRERHQKSLKDVADYVFATLEQLQKFESGKPVLTKHQLKRVKTLLQMWEHPSSESELTSRTKMDSTKSNFQTL